MWPLIVLLFVLLSTFVMSQCWSGRANQLAVARRTTRRNDERARPVKRSAKRGLHWVAHFIGDQMTSTIETDVLAILAVGGQLTADTIARNLNVPPRRVARALHSLRRNGDVFRNRRAAWQITAGQSRTERQAAR
jgi:hypothetical protein